MINKQPEPFKFFDKQQEAYAKLCASTKYTLLYGGSRSGKTLVSVYYCLFSALKYPGLDVLICRKFLADLKASIIHHTLYPLCRFFGNDLYKLVDSSLNKQDWAIHFQNGSTIWFAGLGNKDQVDKILGREYGIIFPDEATQLEYETFNTLQTRLSQVVCPGFRRKMILGCNPTHIDCWLYDLFINNLDPIDKTQKDAKQYNVIQMNPIDNPHLDPDYVRDVLGSLSKRHQRRFLEGEWLDEMTGALWTVDIINRNRVSAPPPEFDKLVIGVDPSTTNNKNSDETGIVMVGMKNDHGYVLADRSQKYSPTTWANEVIRLYHKHSVNEVVVEINQGGEMVKTIIHKIDRTVKIQEVRAATGKYARAEPIVALYEQNYIHHVGYHKSLETQMTTWLPTDQKSPDRIDALVWACYKLFIRQLNFYIIKQGQTISV